MSGNRFFGTDSLHGISCDNRVKVVKLCLNRFVKVGYSHITEFINAL
jgi:hypothetical protein